MRSLTQRFRFMALGLALIAALVAPARAQEEEVETIPSPAIEGEEIPETDPEPGLEFARIKGVNYIPGYAASPYHMWKDYDGERVRLDLARAHRIGFNSVRVFLSFVAYEERPSAFLERFKDFVDACQSEGMSLMPVLFDSWGIDIPRTDLLLDPKGEGSNTEPTGETAKSAYQRFLSRPDAYRLNEELFRRQMRVIAEVASPERIIPRSNDPSAAFWGAWGASPGHDRMGKKHWPACKAFMKEIMTPYLDSPFIVAWDVMNQPETIKAFSKPAPTTEAFEFAGQMLLAARALKPKRPLTVGAGLGWSGAQVYAKKVDLISLQVVQGSGSELAVAVKEARRMRRPAIVSLAGGAMFPATERELEDESQRELVRRTMLQLRASRVGFYLWHLVEGETITPWAALIRRDGTLKPAAEFLKRDLAD